jgi:hypothetical protein
MYSKLIAIYFRDHECHVIKLKADICALRVFIDWPGLHTASPDITGARGAASELINIISLMD